MTQTQQMQKNIQVFSEIFLEKVEGALRKFAER